MSEENKFDYERSLVEVCHLIKYNLYLLAKSVIFHAISSSADSPEEAIEATNNIMEKMDLEHQRILKQQNGNSSNE